jgi:hypothetical protein
MFEDIKEVIRSRKSQDRHCNGLQKKDNDLQITIRFPLLKNDVRFVFTHNFCVGVYISFMLFVFITHTGVQCDLYIIRCLCRLTVTQRVLRVEQELLILPWFVMHNTITTKNRG